MKQAKSNHNWGDNTLTINIEKKIMAASLIKKILLKPSQRPKYVDDDHGWEKGLLN